jgi:hypothetical protein
MAPREIDCRNMLNQNMISRRIIRFITAISGDLVIIYLMCSLHVVFFLLLDIRTFLRDKPHCYNRLWDRPSRYDQTCVEIGI